MNKKFVHQVGNNKKVILWCTANQISTFLINVKLYLCRFPICYVTMHSLCSVQEENARSVRNAYRSECFNSRTAAWIL